MLKLEKLTSRDFFEIDLKIPHCFSFFKKVGEQKENNFEH